MARPESKEVSSLYVLAALMPLMLYIYMGAGIYKAAGGIPLIL